MLTNLPEMDAVRVFAAIVEAGSFQAAGRLLGLPRSTISHRLAALETALGVQLLARTTRTVALTEAGRDYYQRVHPALQLLADANQRMASLTEVPRGILRVTASPGMASMWLTPVAERMLTRHPEVKLMVTLTAIQSILTPYSSSHPRLNFAHSKASPSFAETCRFWIM